MGDFFTSRATQITSGRTKYKMRSPEKGSRSTYFRLMHPSWLELDLQSYPIMFWDHKVISEALGRKTGMSWHIPCLGSAHAPNSGGKWDFDDEGVARCLALKFPTGVSLHQCEPVRQRARVLVYQYNHNDDPINALRWWEFSTTQRGSNIYHNLKSGMESRIEEGHKPMDLIYKVTNDTPEGEFYHLAVEVLAPIPGSDLVVMCPFGEEQQSSAKKMANEVFKEYQPWMSADDVFKMLNIEQKPTTSFHSGTAGFGSPATVAEEDDV